MKHLTITLLTLLMSMGAWADDVTLDCKCLENFETSLNKNPEYFGKKRDIECPSTSSITLPFSNRSLLTINPDLERWLIFGGWKDMTEVTDTEYVLYLENDSFVGDEKIHNFKTSLKLNRYSLIFNYRHWTGLFPLVEYGSTFQCKMMKRKI